MLSYYVLGWTTRAGLICNGHHRRRGLASVSINDNENAQHHPYTWQELRQHAGNQSLRYSAGEYPGRSPAGNTQYAVYKAWCRARGITNPQYVIDYVQWHNNSALEPALAPYLLVDGIEHWVLWHHPRRLPGKTVLNPDEEQVLALSLLAIEGAHLSKGNVLCYQNVPQLRSLPTIAHSHVFLHVGVLTNASRRLVARMRSRWEQRSPWLQEHAARELPLAPLSSES
jgi:hypothetical protein